MIPYTAIYLYLGLLPLTGYALVSWSFDRDRHWAEQVGLSFAGGIGVVAMVLFSRSMAGAVPSRPVLIAIGAVAAAVSLTRLIRAGRAAVPVPPSKPARDAFTPLGVIGLLAIVLAVSTVDARTHWPGFRDFDAFAIWLFKAKALALQPLRPVPDFLVSLNLSYSHQDYPLGFPLIVAGLYAAVGKYGSAIADTLLLPIYVAVLAVAYGGLRRLHRRAVALAVAAVFLSAPTFTRISTNGVPESMLALMLLSSLVLLARWAEGGTRNDLALAGFFAAIAAFTKNEGLALLPVIGVGALAVALGRRSGSAFGDWVCFAVVAAVVIGPWILLRRFVPKTHEDYGSKITSPATIWAYRRRVVPTISAMARFMAMPENSGLIWYLLVITAGFGWRAFHKPVVRVLWFILIGQLALYVGTLVVTPWDPTVLIPMITPRLLAQAAPAAVLLIGLHLRETGWGVARAPQPADVSSGRTAALR